MQREVQRRFDLEQGPLLRVGLVRLGAEEHILHITLHHIIADGWSMQVLMREMGELYGALSRGQEAALGELPIQYADFATWQREWLRGAVLEEQLSYWQGQLAGAPALLELPTDWARPRVQGYEGSATVSAEWRTEPGAGRVEPARGGDVVHDAAGGVAGAAGTLQRNGRRQCGESDRGTHAGGDAGVDRIFCEHAGAADEAERGGKFSGVVAAGERGVSGSLCASGHSV